jgi:hypothetical protein
MRHYIRECPSTPLALTYCDFLRSKVHNLPHVCEEFSLSLCATILSTMSFSLNPKNWQHDWKKAQTRMGWTAAVFLVISVGVCFWGFGQGFDPHKLSKIAQAILLGLWVLAPPIWFWYEYFFLYSTYTAPSGAAKPLLEEFKHGQDQSAKIWLALVTLLFGLYFGKDLIRDTPPPAPPVNPQVTCICPQPSAPAPPASTPTSQPRKHPGKNQR